MARAYVCMKISEGSRLQVSHPTCGNKSKKNKNTIKEEHISIKEKQTKKKQTKKKQTKQAIINMSLTLKVVSYNCALFLLSANLHATLFTIASAMVIYVRKLPLGACSIQACSISKLWKWIGC